MAKWHVSIRWRAVASFEVEAPSEQAAVDKAQENGLPWVLAEEADDGEGYEIHVEEIGSEEERHGEA